MITITWAAMGSVQWTLKCTVAGSNSKCWWSRLALSLRSMPLRIRELRISIESYKPILWLILHLTRVRIPCTPFALFHGIFYQHHCLQLNCEYELKLTKINETSSLFKYQIGVGDSSSGPRSRSFIGSTASLGWPNFKMIIGGPFSYESKLVGQERKSTYSNGFQHLVLVFAFAAVARTEN